MYVTGLGTVLCYYVVHVLMYVATPGVRAWPEACPTTCTCGLMTSSMTQRQQKTVSCDGETLTAPPFNMSTDVEVVLLAANRIHPENLASLADYGNLSEVNLASNHIYGLGEVTVDLPSLFYLTLDGNEMDYFAAKTFWWAPHLRVLSARSNKLELMHADAFLGLTELHSLDLSGNRLFSVTPNWFRDLTSLSNLVLGQNNIHVLRDDVFAFLVSLKSLDLSHNQLNFIHDNAFSGLNSLHRLSLMGNSLKSVPLPSLQRINSLNELNFNSNPITRLDTNSISNLSISYLTLSHMNQLEFIDRHSITDLANLNKLEMTHNRILHYMDPGSFHDVPLLRELGLQHNNLSVFQEDLIDNLPSLNSIGLEGNSLFCDCNAWWLLDGYKDHTRNLSLPEARSLICDGPAAVKGQTLDAIDPAALARPCPPRILSLFAQQYHVDLGDPLRLDCRAVGNPTPQTDWLLPSAYKPTSDSIMVLKTDDGNRGGLRQIEDHISISDAGTVFVAYAQGLDSGDYTCLASNPNGRDERVTHIHVKTNLASVVIMGVYQTSITITWRSTSYHHQYKILYRKHSSNETYQTVSIEPYMRTFSANGLDPDTTYQFCMAMKLGNNIVKINCTLINTKSKNSQTFGLFDARNYIIGGALGTLAVIVVLICTMMYFIKRYNKRKRLQEELYTDNLSQLFLASMDSMSDTTPITYENRGAEMFDDDDIDEIRSTASMPSCSTNTTIIK